MCKLATFIVFLSCFSNLTAQTSDARIDSIQIIRHQVFEDTLQKPSFFYKGANAFHKLTRQKVIQNRLLFKKGDSLDLQLLYETEIRLRKFDFLSAAKTTADTIDGKIIVTVETKDNWSLIPIWTYESSNGYETYGIGLAEYNFLGLGKTLAMGYVWESDVGGTVGASYKDPQLFGSQWKADLSGNYGPNSHLFSSSAYRPFYSSDIPWSYGLDVELEESVDRTFDAGSETSRMYRNSSSTSAYLARRVGERYKNWRFAVYFEYSDDKYSDIDEATTLPLPEDELINSLSIAVKKKNLHFAKDIRLDKFVVKEDLFLGTEISGYFGKTAFPINVGVDRFEYGATFKGKFEVLSQSYIGFSLDYDTKETVDEIYSADIDFYSRITPNQTLAFYVQTTYSDNLRPYKQFLLGGDNGLRGYPARFVSGDYLFATTIEDRIFTGLQLMGVELGGVVFSDAGYVWKKDQSASANDILVSVGIGLRLGFYAYPGAEVFRIDYGIPLNGMPPQFSIGFGQNF